MQAVSQTGQAFGMGPLFVTKLAFVFIRLFVFFNNPHDSNPNRSAEGKENQKDCRAQPRQTSNLWQGSSSGVLTPTSTSYLVRKGKARTDGYWKALFWILIEEKYLEEKHNAGASGFSYKTYTLGTPFVSL